MSNIEARRSDDVELHLWAASDQKWRQSVVAGTSPVCSGAESFIAGTASCRIAVHAIDELSAELSEQLVPANAQLHDEPWAREFGVLDADRNLVTFFQRRWHALVTALERLRGPRWRSGTG